MGGLPSSRSSEPVSRPTALKIPPQVPLADRRGLAGGSAVGRLAHGAATPAGGAAKRSRPQCHEQRRPCGRRATKRSDWRGGRAAASTSSIRSSAARHRAWRVAGVTIWPVRSPRSAASWAQRRSVRQARSSFTRSVKEARARDPRARERAAVVGPPAPPAWPCSRKGWPSEGSRRAAARRAAQQPGPAQPDAPEHLPWQLRSHGPTPIGASVHMEAVPDPSTPARVAPAIRGCRPAHRAKYDRPDEPSRTLLADWPEPVPAPLADGWPRGAVDRGRSLDRSVGVRPHTVTALGRTAMKTLDEMLSLNLLSAVQHARDRGLDRPGPHARAHPADASTAVALAGTGQRPAERRRGPAAATAAGGHFVVRAKCAGARRTGISRPGS